MKQKVFTLLTLLVLCVTGAWADDPITVTWPMIDGENATSQAGSANVVGVLTVNDATLCPTSDFNNLAWTTSRNLKYSTDGENVDVTFYAGGVAVTNNPNEDSDNASVNDKCYLKFTFTVAGDKTFTPTGFSFDCGKAGTDAGCVQGALILADGSTKSTSSIVKPTRSDKKYMYESHVSKTIADADAFVGGSTVTFYIYLGGKLNSRSVYFKDVTITGTYAAGTTAENAPEKPTFSVDGGAVDGASTTTIESTYATKIFYVWTASSEAPAVGNAAYTEVSGDSYVFTIPNTTANMYLHAYGWNNHNTSTASDIKSALFNVTKVYSPAKTWDFTSTPADVLEALGNTSNWNYTESSKRYTNKSTVAADSELGTLTAASWSGIQVGGSISAGNLRINKDAYIQINGAGYYTIKSLKDGDVVKVRCYSANQTSDRSLAITGGDVTSASAPQSNNGYAETTITKDGDGDLRLTNTGGGINIMSIALNEDLPAAPTVAISTASGKTYATYVTSYALDFSTVSDDIKAYVAASEAAGTNITFTGKDAVPAGTPILVKTTTPGATVNVPVASSAPAAVGTNKLVAGTGAAISYDAGESQFYYILTNGQFKPANNSVVAVGKAYLSLDNAVSAQELTISFDDEEGDVTGIKNLTTTTSKGKGVAYNLAGQRVNASHKGIVIVNGKKYLNK